MLTDSQVRQFQSNGFTMAQNFFDEKEIRALRRELLRFVDEGLFRNVATRGDGSSHTPDDGEVNLQAIPMDIDSDLFKALPFCDKVSTSVSQLLGDPVYKILDQAFYKPAGRGLPTNWHTDNAYFRISNPLKGTAMWIAVDDARKENGTLKVIPGVFDREFEHYRDPASDHHIRMAADESKVVHCELEAGGVVFFCYGTPHATGPNRTDRDRVGIGLHFLHADALDAISRYSKQLRKGAIAVTGEDACGGANRYQADYSDRWRDLVEELAG